MNFTDISVFDNGKIKFVSSGDEAGFLKLNLEASKFNYH